MAMLQDIASIWPGLSRRLDSSMSTGNYYEAQQIFRVIYHRLIHRKMYRELLALTETVTVAMINKEQYIIGADFAILLLDALVKSKCSDYNHWIPLLGTIFANMLPDTPERDAFLAKALRWSSNNGRHIGHHLLHQHIGKVYWSENNCLQARQHYIYSMDGISCAKILIELQRKHGYKGEVDLFIAQAVLQYLCLSNTRTAHQTFVTYTNEHPCIRKTGPPYLWPLLNFIFYLLQAVESRKINVFAVLCEQYEPSIKQDPSYVEYLDRIGQIFFGIKPQPTTIGLGGRSGGMFSYLFDSFFHGLEENDDDGIDNRNDANGQSHDASVRDRRVQKRGDGASASTSSASTSKRAE